MTLKDIRWKQRFNNLKKAYGQLIDANEKFPAITQLVEYLEKEL